MEGSIVIISGFSGSGKGTLVNCLLQKYSKDFALSISATTRNPRPGESHGVHYFFITKEEFEQMIQKEELLEYARYVDNYYGTPKSYVDEQLKSGKNVLLEIEIQGAMKIKEKYPDTKLIFITTVDALTLYGRLKGRETETEEVIRKRMNRAIEESSGIENYDYLVINDDLDQTTDLIYGIIQNERNDKKNLNAANFVANQIDFIKNMRDELISFSKGDLK